MKPVVVETELTRQNLLEALARNGLVLIPGYSDDPDQFEQLGARVFSERPVHQNVKLGTRDAFTDSGKVYSVDNVACHIPWHSEMTWRPQRPDAISFMCIHPGDSGGETEFVDGKELLAALTPEDRQFVEGCQVVLDYDGVPSDYKGAFDDLFEVNLNEGAEALARCLNRNFAKLGLTCMEFWEKDGRVVGEYRTPLLLPTKLTGDPVFCNYIVNSIRGKHIQHPYTRMPDGSDFPNDLLERIEEAADRVKYSHKWSPGDVLIADNTRVMHARAPYAGPRKIAVQAGFLDWSGISVGV